MHNTYFTLPVLIAMLSNHYGWLYQGPHNWLVLVLLMLAGALIRHFFVARHKAKVKGDACRGATRWSAADARRQVFWLRRRRRPRAPPRARQRRSRWRECKPVIDQRCAMCHNAQLQQKNVRAAHAGADQAACAGGLPAGGGAEADARPGPRSKACRCWPSSLIGWRA